MPPTRKFVFVCGQDDFLVDRIGRERFNVMAEGTTDDFSREVISGFAANSDEVAVALGRFREAVQTVPMFGGKHVVWLKDVSFLANTQTGNADTTLELVAGLQELLERFDAAETAVLITAAPVDRRTSFFKWCERNADFVQAGGKDSASPEALASVAMAEARSLNATFGPGAVELLVARVGATTRLLVEEVRKLANYAEGVEAGRGASTGSASASGVDGLPRCVISESDVAELTPNTAEGDFFETAEAFGSGDLTWTLAALERHFFTGGDARPILAALQNRNRLMIQLRALADAGEARVGERGVEGLHDAAEKYSGKFGEAADEKSSLNVFTQNPWYVGKLAGRGRLPSLRRLIDTQAELISAFEEINRRPQEQEEVLREMAVRCLAG